MKNKIERKKPGPKSMFETEVIKFLDSLESECIPTVPYDEAVRIVASLRYADEITSDQAVLLIHELNHPNTRKRHRDYVQMLLAILREQGINPFLSYNLLLLLGFLLYSKEVKTKQKIDPRDKQVSLPDLKSDNEALRQCVRKSVAEAMA
jgi:hypothetical protein